jgi:hypothetical protein
VRAEFGFVDDGAKSVVTRAISGWKLRAAAPSIIGGPYARTVVMVTLAIDR